MTDQSAASPTPRPAPTPTLDALPRLGSRIPHDFGGALLRVVVQRVLVAPGPEMQDRPHAQQEVLCIDEARRPGRPVLQQQRIRQQRDRPGGRQIPQGTGRLLDVRLQLIERAVETGVAFVDERRQRRQDERMGGRCVEQVAEALEELPVALQQAGVEQRQQCGRAWA